ncbi:hypothetical protein D9M68_933150 [compost metagenome]
MNLAVFGDFIALRPEDDRGVVMVVTRLFDHRTGMQRDAEFLGQPCHALVDRAVRKTFAAAMNGIATFAQESEIFRQHDEIGLFSRYYVAHQPLGVVKVFGLVRVRVHLNETDFHWYPPRLCWSNEMSPALVWQTTKNYRG